MSRVPRFHAPELPIAPGARLELEGEEAHHATSVLRLTEGAQVEVFDGKGGAGTFEVESGGRGGLVLALVRRTDEDREARSAITIAFAPPRPKRMLALVEKATELGVARFLPLTTARTRVTLKESALDKIRRRTIEAAKQCGRNRLPVVSPTATIETLAREERGKHDLALLPDTQNARPLKDVLRAVPTARTAIFVVGPEGGFEDRERKSLGGAGFVPVVFGGATLRVETAAIAVLTCLRYDLG